LIASTKLGQRRGSTPMISVRGDRRRSAIATPAMSPPPPIGTTTAVGLMNLLEDLERHRSLPRDDRGIVEAVDVREPLGRDQLVALHLRVGDRLAVQQDARPQPLAARSLHERGKRGHHDGDGNPELPAVKCERQRVIAGAGGNDAVAPLRRIKQEERVAGTALLERAGPLRVLELGVNLAAGEIREIKRLATGRDEHAVGDALASGDDVVEGNGGGKVSGHCKDRIQGSGFRGQG
jgi:hypothetical protein